MGNKEVSKKEKEKQEAERIKALSIDRKLKKEDGTKAVKMLVLGTGDSGKSTFIKQIDLLFGKGFNERDREIYKRKIRENLYKHLKILVEYVQESDFDVSDKMSRAISRFMEEDEKLSNRSLEKYIKILWENGDALKQAFDERYEFNIPDSASYFLDSYERILDEEYEPSDLDILYCRIPTTGINSVSFDVNEKPWTIVDVGGQRSERRKWIHQFDDVTIIVYVVALSEYNQKLFEDEKINRMKESLQLFEETINSKSFRDKNCILLLNKADLFKEKIEKKKILLSDTFPEFRYDGDYKKGIDFIENLFVSKVKYLDKRSVFRIVSVGIDTEEMRGVFDIMNTTVLELDLKKNGLL